MSLALVDLPVAPPLTPASMEEEVAPHVAQAPSLLDGSSGLLEEASMEVKNITTLSDEVFVVEAIISIERVSKETIELLIQQTG